MCFWFFFCGTFVSIGAFIKTYAPFVIIVLVTLLSAGVIF